MKDYSKMLILIIIITAKRQEEEYNAVIFIVGLIQMSSTICERDKGKKSIGPNSKSKVAVAKLRGTRVLH